MSNPTFDLARRLWDHMTALHKTKVVVRPRIGSRDVLRLVLRRMGVIPEAFSERWAFTLGGTIYLPFAPGEGSDRFPAWYQMKTCFHEHEHAIQFRRLGLTWINLAAYLASRAQRTHWEVQAYRTELELEWWRFGRIAAGTVASLEHLLGEGYRLGDDDLRVASVSLRALGAIVQRGGVTSVSVRSGLPWLEENAAHLRERDDTN